MTYGTIINTIRIIFLRFFEMFDYHYHMIVDNSLILAFVLMCSIFVGLALLKRLIHIK